MVFRTIAISGCVLLAATAALAETPAAKDQSRLPAAAFDLAQDTPAPAEAAPAVEGEDGAAPGDELSLGEIPVLETVELTGDTAKRAIDGYALVKEKYKDADLESYETLQDFVDQALDGKTFDTDVKSFGFATVNEWNVAVTSISIAYMALNDDPTADIRAQIEEIKADTELAQDMRDRMIASLTATIPSDNNLKVVRELAADPGYAEKLKLLETESEGE